MWSAVKSLTGYLGLVRTDIEIDIDSVGDISELPETSEYVLTVVQQRVKKEYVGKITYLNDRVAVIDNEFYFHLRNVDLPYLKVSDKVKCNLYANKLDVLVRDVELINTGTTEEELDVIPFSGPKRELNGMVEKIIKGVIGSRFSREVSVRRDDGLDNIKLSLDKIASEFIPSEGDHVQLSVLLPEENSEGCEDGMIVEKISPVTVTIKSGTITSWNGCNGIIGNFALFCILACEPGYQPSKGDKVLCSLIKSSKDVYKWRAIQIIPQTKNSGGTTGKNGDQRQNELLRDKFGIVIGNINKIVLKYGEKTTVKVNVANTSNEDRMLTECSVYTIKELSQVKIISPKNTKISIKPGTEVTFTFEVHGSFLGRSSEQCTWIFWGFSIGRIFDMQVNTQNFEESGGADNSVPLARRDVTATQLLDRSSGIIMPGRRSFSPAAFVPVKLGQFSLSDKILKAALPDIKMNLDDLMIRVVRVLPCLGEDLKPDTYLPRMHSLLYLEEVAMLKQVGELELQRAKFTKFGDCLILEVPPLSAYTTKLVAGDMLIARSPRPKKPDEPKYEGVIHRVTPTELHLQFAQDFHDTYVEGSEYSVSFVTSRASLRRMHQAILLAVKHLGIPWLFPTQVNSRPPQVIIQDETFVEEKKTDSGKLNESRDLKLLVDKKLAEDMKEGKILKPTDYIKYAVESIKGSTEDSRKNTGNVSKEMLFYSPDPRKLSVDLNRKYLSLEQKFQLPAVQENVFLDRRMKNRRGGAHSSRDINWNRHGSGYGMHCTVDNESKVKISVEQHKIIKWFNKGLNAQQRDAVRNVLKGEARPLPYVIFGPPGTGKTVTVVETILQIHTLIPESRLLVATPSNSAADLIAERLLESGCLQQGDLLRMVGYHYLEQGRISASIIPFSAVPDVKAINVAGSSGSSHEGVQMCGRELLGRHSITVGTLGCLGLLYNMGFPRGHFTHVIVDEAGQATEPEVLIPMVFLHMQYGQVVLAGDPLQLGPVVTSRLASRCGLQDSLLSRLLSRFPYTRDPIGFPDTSGYDPRLVTKLVNNYRSLPKILKLPSMLFYDNHLIPNVSETESQEAQVLAALGTSFPRHRDGIASPLLFHGVRGENMQESESHSWYNPHEVVQCTMYLNMLYAAGLKPEEVGIITPYQLQSNKIRFMLERMAVEPPKVGSVEEFQGQEKMAIIVSVVRSSPEIITVDMQKALGFVANGRRLNVALSRARAVLIILGNPHLLSLDTHWRSVLKHCVETDSYVGCDLPSDFYSEKPKAPWEEEENMCD